MMFRDVLIRLYKHSTRRVIVLPPQVGLRCLHNTGAELGIVLELLPKSIHRMAHPLYCLRV